VTINNYTIIIYTLSREVGGEVSIKVHTEPGLLHRVAASTPGVGHHRESII